MCYCNLLQRLPDPCYHLITHFIKHFSCLFGYFAVNKLMIDCSIILILVCFNKAEYFCRVLFFTNVCFAVKRISLSLFSRFLQRFCQDYEEVQEGERSFETKSRCI